MYSSPAAPWSTHSPKESRYRITHQTQIKQRVNGQPRQQQWEKEDWTWEEILDGKGPWAEPVECRRPKAELEAAKAERRRYEEAARKQGWKPASTTLKFLGGWLRGSGPRAGRRPAPTSQANRGEREYGQTPCYAVERTVSPVRVHSPVRVIPPPRTGRARLSIEPSAMRPALHIWPPVRLLGPAYMAPALRMVSPVRLHSPVRVIPPPRTGRATGSIQPGKVGQARCSREPVRLHGPVFPALPPRPSPVPPVPAPRTKPPVRLQSPVPPPRTLPMVRVSSPVPPVPAPRTKPSVRLQSPVRTVPSPRTRPEVRALSPVPPVPVPRTRPIVRFERSVCPVPAPRTSLEVRAVIPVPPVPAPRTRPTVHLSRAESAVCPTPSALPVCPAPSEPSSRAPVIKGFPGPGPALSNHAAPQLPGDWAKEGSMFQNSK
ncbi:uncharacterized protein ACWYII_041088 [Salvelinus alpinus]